MLRPCIESRRRFLSVAGGALALFLLGAAQDAEAVNLSVGGAGGTQLFEEQHPFTVHGVEFDALVAPRTWLQTGNSGAPYAAYLNAHDAFANRSSGTAALSRAKRFGANTIEFKVSQAALDPSNNGPSPIRPERIAYDHGYETEVLDAVSLARSMGFVVIVSLQDTPVSGGPATPHPGLAALPTAVTRDAAASLAAKLKGDGGVMIEIMAEPYGTSSCAWPCYIKGGTDSSGIVHVGVNEVIARMRRTGSENMIVVEALVQDFSPYESAGGGYPYGAIVDASGVRNKLMFGLHPYLEFPQIGVTPAQWDRAFGNFSATHPVLVTEWNENTTRFEEWCLPPDQVSSDGRAGEGAPLDTPLRLLRYLEARRINGVVAWSFDLPATFLDGKGEPATMCNAACGTEVKSASEPLGRAGGVGVWLQDYFRVDGRTLPPLDSPLCSPRAGDDDGRRGAERGSDPSRRLSRDRD